MPYLIVERNQDLANASGYPFETTEAASRNIAKQAGCDFIRESGVGIIRYSDTSFGPFWVYRGTGIDYWIVPVGLAGYVAMYLTTLACPASEIEFTPDNG